MESHRVQFSVLRWAFWTQGERSLTAEVPEIPPLLRRRASPAARAALRVAFDCVGAKGQVPAVFCSRHGEVKRSVELLSPLVAGEPLSANGFALSVHNAAAALYSLTRGDTTPSSAIAAGEDGLSQGVIEAAGQLAAGCDQVLVVGYDDALPVPFEPFVPEAQQAHAVGLLLGRTGSPIFSLELTAGSAAPSGEDEVSSGLTALLSLLRGERTELELNAPPRLWTWRRHA